MLSTAEDSISSSTIAAGDGREVAAAAAAAAAAAVATNTTTTASHSYYNLCNFCLVSRRRGAQDSERSTELEQGVSLLKTERERDRRRHDDRGNEVNSATHGGIGRAGRFR